MHQEENRFDIFEHFDPWLLCEPELAEDLYRMIEVRGYKAAQKVMAVSTIVGNVIEAWRAGRVVALSRDRGSYSAFPFYGLWHYTYRSVIPVVDGMITNGLLGYEPGFLDRKTGVSRRSRIWVTGELLEAAVGRDTTRRLGMKLPLVLRKRVGGQWKLQRYQIDDHARRMLGRLYKYNELAGSRQVVYESLDHLEGLRQNLDGPLTYGPLATLSPTPPPTTPYKDIPSSPSSPVSITQNVSCVEVLRPAEGSVLLDCRLHRVFNGDWKHGGRHYMRGRNIPLALSEEERQMIRIDGEPTVEHDFSAMHARMLYHLEDRECPGDPYEGIAGGNDARPAAKLAMLVAINASSRRDAVGALIEECEKDPELAIALAASGLNASQMIEATVTAHEPVGGYFFSGVGLRLQCLDSQIASDVLDHFADREVLVIPVHDSFIVQERHRLELAGVMSDAYERYMGRRCPVKPNKEECKCQT